MPLDAVSTSPTSRPTPGRTRCSTSPAVLGRGFVSRDAWDISVTSKWTTTMAAEKKNKATYCNAVFGNLSTVNVQSHIPLSWCWWIGGLCCYARMSPGKRAIYPKDISCSVRPCIRAVRAQQVASPVRCATHLLMVLYFVAPINRDGKNCFTGCVSTITGSSLSGELIQCPKRQLDYSTRHDDKSQSNERKFKYVA